ncbi:MAG: AAC(3) family N-acetyltransferase [Lachnospiraceae bacterium]|nr:AAC(3) family N-acetyltransferase [Lachnospiraceae bacterium]
MGYTYNDIVDALKNLNINEGDSIFVHSNLGFFGKMENCSNADELCENFLNAIVEVIGEEGTLVLPAFSYSFCNNEIFDVNNTCTKCGIFSEYLRKKEGSVRSQDPNFSIVAYGKEKIYYTENPTNESFGKGSFWERFLNRKGKIVCMNFDSGSTFVHYVERQNNVPYRYNKAFNGIIKDRDKERKDYFVHYVYDKDVLEDAPSFNYLDALCKKNGICKSVCIGRGIINAMESKVYYDFICEMLKKEPRFLTRGRV